MGSIHQCLPIWLQMTPDDLEVTFKILGINNWPHPPSFISIHQCLPIWPWMTPDDLEVTFKIVGINNWPHLPSFISIHQVVYPIYPIWPHSLVDLWWCWSTDHYKLGLSVIEMHPPSRDAPIHQVSGPCDPQSPRSPFDLRWPLMTVTTFGTNN